MTIKRIAILVAAGAAATMMNAAPANAEGDIYTGACGQDDTQLAFVGEAPTEPDAVNQAKAAAIGFNGRECSITFGATKNECIAVAINDKGIWTSAIRRSWTMAEDAAATQLMTKFPGDGARTAVAHCSGGGMEAYDPAAAAAPDPKPAEPAEPAPDKPCLIDPFDLIPGVC